MSVTPEEKELGPIEKLVRGHVTVENEAKSLRIRCRKGKWAQNSFEESVAENYGFQMHRGFWVLMEKVPFETVDEDGKKQKSFQLALPGYAVEAFRKIEEAAEKKSFVVVSPKEASKLPKLEGEDALAMEIASSEFANKILPQSV